MSTAHRPRSRLRLRALTRRLPLRLRLVAGFAAAMIVVLTASGAFVYWRVEYALDRRLDTDLTAEAAALRPQLNGNGVPRAAPTVTDPALSDFQVLDPTGRVVSSGTGLGTTPLLDAATLARARRAPVTVDVGSLLPISARPLRLLAQPWSPASPYVLVVGVRRDERDEALRELIVQLAIAALGTLVITTAVGERLAKAALVPVERYRTRALSIAAGATGVRLDVPAGRDDEVTRLGRTLNEMLDALERSLVRERRFLDDASHELRTPLTLLLTRVQLTLRRPRSTAEHERVLAELQTDITQLAALAETLLAIGATSGSTAGAAGETGDVTRVARSLAGAGPAPGLPPEWSLDASAAGTTSVHLSDARLRQVLLNLLTNAHLHGAAPVLVAVRPLSTPEGDVVVVTVTDEGPGIDGNFLPRAVERFHRSDDARARPGAGLGLSLVHALIEESRGELRLCSQGVHHRFDQRFDIACTHPAQGTTATVMLQTAGGLLEADRTSPT